jgi:DHA1 family arabinose polymer transporter-like MFS transporter
MMGLLPHIASDFKVSIPVAGYVISAYALGVVIGAPLLTTWGGRMRPRRLLVLLMALFTAFNLLSAFAPNNTALFIARLLSGLPHGAFFGVGSVVASRLAEKGKQAQAISTMFAGLTIANLLMVPLGTYLGESYSWRYALGAVAGMGLFTLLFIRRSLPDLPAENTNTLREQLSIFKRADIWLIILITAIGTGGLFCWISYISPLMTKISQFSPGTVPYIMMLVGLGMVVGNILGGKLADRFTPLSACLALLLAMAAALLVVSIVSYNQSLSLVMTFVTGICAMAVGAPIQILMIRSSEGAKLLGASITQAAFNIGNALGAFLGGLPIAAGYGYTSPAVVGVGMALGGATFAYALLKVSRSEQMAAA